MKRLLLILGFLCAARAATITMTAPFTAANFAATYNGASCGDVIRIPANQEILINASSSTIVLSKDCGSNAITVTTDADPTWLPDPRARILPSYRSWVPRFTINATPDQAMEAMFVFNGKGIKLDKISFQLGSSFSPNLAGYLYLLKFGRDAIADYVTLNHVLLYGPSHSLSNWLSSVMVTTAGGTTWTDDFTFTNSYVGGMQGAPQGTGQSMGDPNVVKAMAGTNWRMSNNIWCCGFTEFFISGGNPFSTSYTNPMMHGIMFEHNIGLNALRFLSSAPNFVGTNNRPTMKNFFEMKNGENAVVRWNTFENQWNDTGASQWWAVKLAQYVESQSRQTWQIGCSSGTATTSAGDNGPGTKVTVSGCGANRNPYLLALNHTGAWFGLAKISNPDESMYLSNGNIAWQWRLVTRIEKNTSMGCTDGQAGCGYIAHVDAPYDQALTTTGAKFAAVSNPWTTVRNVEIYGNVWRNVATGFAYEGIDFSWCNVNPAQAGYCAPMKNVIYRDNVQIYSSPYLNFSGINSTMFNFHHGSGPAGVKAEHNTLARLATAGSNTPVNSIFRFEPDRGSFSDFTMRSNLASSPGNYGGVTGSYLAGNSDAGTRFSHNSYLGTAGSNNGSNQWSINTHECGAGGRICQPNYFSDYSAQNVDFRFLNDVRNDFRIKSNTAAVCAVTSTNPLTITTCAPHGFLPGQPVRLEDLGGLTYPNPCESDADGRDCYAGHALVYSVPNSATMVLRGFTDNNFTASGTYTSGGRVRFALWKGGHDGDQVGARLDQVALIQGLTIVPSTNYAQFQWRLPLAVSDQICQMEVSPNSGLLNDDGDYTVVAAVNPAFFKRADHDSNNTRASVSATRTTRTFRVGDAATVTGDDGVSHDLRLSANTLYYYRLTCGGAMERGSFRTLP